MQKGKVLKFERRRPNKMKVVGKIVALMRELKQMEREA